MTLIDPRTEPRTGARDLPPRPEGPSVLPPAEEIERRRTTSGLRRSDVLSMLGAGLGSICLTTLLFTQLAPFTGKVGFVLVAYVSFLGLYVLLVSFDEDGPAVRDRLASVVVQSLAFLLLLVLVLVVLYTVQRGLDALPNRNFYTQDLSDAGPLEPLSVGGVLHGIVGTLQQIGMALLIVIPLGLTCAVFLNEVRGAFSRFVRTVVEAMTALPSIVAGLFIYATVVLALGRGKSGLAAALAISVMMLPIVIRAADVVLRVVPGSLQEASLALGASQWRTVWHVTLPTAKSGLATAVILGTARGIGETSPVLLTAGYTTTLNLNPLSGPQVPLPLLVFEAVKSPSPAIVARGFGAAVVLLALVLLLFVLARTIGGRGPGNLSRRQLRRRARASQQDVARMAAAHPAPTEPAGPSGRHSVLSDPTTRTPPRHPDGPRS